MDKKESVETFNYRFNLFENKILNCIPFFLCSEFVQSAIYVQTYAHE